MVGRRAGGLLARALGVLRRAGGRRPLHRPDDARAARRPVVPRRAPVVRRARLPRPRRRRDRRAPRVRAAPARGVVVGRAARADRPHPRRPGAARRRARRRASSRTCRTSPRRSPHSSPPPRSVRSGRRARPTSASRASSTDSRRSSPSSSSRSTATGTAARTTTAAPRSPRSRPRCPRCARPSPCSYLGLEGDWDAALPTHRRAAGVRARPVRPPAVRALLERHHRPAEGDRARPRRHPARAPRVARDPDRREGRRPPLLVHDHRLDDVERARLRPAHPRLDRALRRQPRLARHGRAVGSGRGQRHHDHGRRRRLHPRLHEGRRRAPRRPRLGEPPRRRIDRIAALARGLRLDLRAARRPDVAVLDVGRHRRLLGLRRRHPDRAGAPRRDPGAPPRRRRRGVRRAGPQRGRRPSASWC